jgi:CBS domain containing-hemolysin-like protein
MDGALVLKWAAWGGLLAASGAFSMAETAFLSLSRLQLSRLRKSHPGRLAFWENGAEHVLASILVGNNLVNVGLGVLAVSLALDLGSLEGVSLGWMSAALSGLTAAAVILFGEIAPKVLARRACEPVALALALPVRWWTGLSAPLVWGLVRSTSWLLGRLTRLVRAEGAVWTPSAIQGLLERASTVRPLRGLLGNVLDFAQTSVDDVMTPRDRITALDLRLPPRELARRALASGFSRLPLVRGRIDNVEGILYVKDLMAYLRAGALITLDDIIRPVLQVPAHASLAEALRIFRGGGHHLALVADGAGRLEGLVTLQDVLEALVGDIAPEPERRKAVGP